MGEERAREKEELNSLLREIREKARESLIIIEGKKDRTALESLGIRNKFFLLSGQRNSLYESAEKIARTYRKVLLFLDLDEKGRKLAKTMKSYLSSLGVKADDLLAKSLLRLADTQFVEGVGKLLKV